MRHAADFGSTPSSAIGAAQRGRCRRREPVALRCARGGLRGRGAHGRHRRPDHRVGPDRARLRPGLRRDLPTRSSVRRSPPTGSGLVADGAGPHGRTVSSPRGARRPGGHGQGIRRRPSARRIGPRPRVRRLVNLGGDVAVAGPVPEGRVGHRRRLRVRDSAGPWDQVVAIFAGGLATSGTTARSWTRNGRRVHHIIDPWTGEAAAAVWSLVSMMAPSCVEANAWSTAAVVWGHDAVGNLSSLGVPARLVDADGVIVHLGDWPQDGAGQAAEGHDARHFLDDPLVHHPGHRHRGPGAVDLDLGARDPQPAGPRPARGLPSPKPTSTSGSRCWPWCFWPSTSSPPSSTPM